MSDANDPHPCEWSDHDPHPCEWSDHKTEKGIKVCPCGGRILLAEWKKIGQ